MLISHDAGYQSAKASVTYWKRQFREAPTDERVAVAIEKIATWGKLLEGYRQKKTRGRRPGALGRNNPLYIPPARMPKKRKEVIKKEREEWKPEPLNWD
jgi:hypothetical protein